MSFEITRVAAGFVVMTAGKDGVAERTLWRYVNMTFVGQDVVIEFPV